MRHAFRALRSRNYRLFFIGQGVSLVGTWMQSVAMSWLVYKITGSAELLGITAFAALAPGFILGPYAGVVVDRIPKKKLLVWTQIAMMIEAAMLAALTFSGLVQVWHIIALSTVLGVIGAFEMPGRQAAMVHLVDNRDDIANVIALNSSQFNLARLIGPALGGIVVQLTGEAWAFTLNAVSYLAVLLALTAITIPHDEPEGDRPGVWSQFAEGARYVKGHEPIRALILFIAGVSFLNGAQSVLMPVLAAQTFHGDAGTLGLLQSAIGVGALFSALMLVARKSVLGLSRWLAPTAGAFGLAILLLGVTNSLPLGLILLALAGAGSMAHMAVTNTLVQTLVEDRMRGRVMSFYVMAFTGTMPFGSLAAGALAHRFGLAWVFVGIGALSIVATALFARGLPRLREVLRPIYIEKGILTPG